MSLSHHNLVAWQRADDLFIKLHRLSLSAFPAIERFALSAQMRRAAYSVPANIVEGFGRSAGRARVNFLSIARASVAEVGYCVHAAHRLGYLSDQVTESLEGEIRQAMAPLVGLIRAEEAKIGIAVVAVLSLVLWTVVKIV